MGEFRLITASHARRDEDQVEVKFLSRNELLYSKAGVEHRITREAMIASDGAPDGSYVYLSDLKLSPEKENEIMADMNAAAVLLKTKFQF